jgi:hypothetical protein
MMFEELERRVDAVEHNIVHLIRNNIKALDKVISIEANCFIAVWLSAIALAIGFAAFLIAIFK